MILREELLPSRSGIAMLKVNQYGELLEPWQYSGFLHAWTHYNTVPQVKARILGG